MARERLSALIEGGYPVVYAIRIVRDWLKEGYYDRLQDAIEDGQYEINLACDVAWIPANCLLAKAEYPEGTDAEFLPVERMTWEEATEER